MRRWTRRGLGRISRHWFVVVSFAAGVAGTVVLHNWLWPPHQTNPSFSGSEINLQILPKGTRLFVQWNPQSLAILQGYSGLLTVQDGGRQVRVPLDRQQLRAGNTSYTPTSEWAEFHLEIYRDGNHYSGEAMALATGLKAKENAVRVDTALVHAVPRPTSEALPLPLSAASSDRSERLGGRSSRGSTVSPGVENRQLREFSRPPLSTATDTGTSVIVEESPPDINLARNKTALIFSLGDPEHPSPRPTLSAATNTSTSAIVEDSPAGIKPAQNSTAVIFPAVDSKHPSPVAEVPLPRSKVGNVTIRTYDGIILDAACDTLTEVRVPDEHQYCALSAATAMFAIRLGDGQTLRFDSVGNLRAQNAKIKNQWVAKTIAGKKIHATVTGVIAGGDLIVLSVQ
jgi:hypothetical protein